MIKTNERAIMKSKRFSAEPEANPFASILHPYRFFRFMFFRFSSFQAAAKYAANRIEAMASTPKNTMMRLIVWMVIRVSFIYRLWFVA
ncbi:hypothetical protein [Rheinheimera tilapiae]|uniref:Uncharacterized protein n=1 Tax=Rheinheimera tilapiae TaxID=875043 RepID=A0ABV6BDX2_9GAMM